jgi:hypothetical protein
MSTIMNAAGRAIDFDAAAILMDKEITDALDNEDLESEQAFFDAYCRAHELKYGEEFEPNKANPVW